MEPAAKLSEVTRIMIEQDSNEQTHIEAILNCPEGTDEQKHELVKTAKSVEIAMQKSAADKNIIKEDKNTNKSDFPKVKIKQQEKSQELQSYAVKEKSENEREI